MSDFLIAFVTLPAGLLVGVCWLVTRHLMRRC
jgi:hypothetical protein